MPYGSYLNTCTGVLQTRENGRTYLYASCFPRSIWPLPRMLSNEFKPNKLDITECQGDIINHGGRLQCSDLPVELKHILTGSYLESCFMSDSRYDTRTLTLHSACPAPDQGYSSLTLNNADSCIGTGKDIALINGQLTCLNDPSREVKQHTASRYLPAGSYITTCRGMSFYPCMSSNKRGVLEAKCADDRGLFVQAILEDGDNRCRMSNLGHVSNTLGELRCDPDITFNDEDPTQGSELLPHFQCNQP